MRWWLVALGMSGQTAMAQDCATITEDAERLACYDTAAEAGPEGCEIEDWRYFGTSIDSVKIEGPTTCPSGRITFRLYEGETFLAAGSTFINGLVFDTYVDIPVAPATMNIRYTIED